MKTGPIPHLVPCILAVVLLGANGFAQTQAQSAAAPGRIGPLQPMSAGDNGTGIREVQTAGPMGGGSGGSLAVPTGNPASAVANSSEILIGPGDLLEVSVYGAPDYIKQVRVSAEGEVTLPLCGAVKLGGMPTERAESVIAKKLADGGYFNDPKVSVLEKEFATQGVSVLGEVQRPGIYPLPGTRSLFDALSAAGGTTARAGNLITVTHRNDPQHPQTVPMVYDGKNSGKSNIAVYPGDTVMVSKAGVVYVTGDVKLPGGFIMENANMTVLQALAMAQGANPTASLDSARVIRNSGQGSKPQEMPIALKKILSSKAPDVNLQANDILFVPSSAAKSAGRRTLDAIVQTVSGMAIYGKVP